MLPKKWLNAVSEIDYAFQPLVNPLTGVTFAVEALIRKVDRAGFASIEEFFDTAYAERVLLELDRLLRRKAIAKFARIEFYQKIKLFYNYDPRILEMPAYRFGETEELLNQYHLTNDAICFELNERIKVEQSPAFKNFLAAVKKRGFQLALDDFGDGFSSYELFYHAEPNFLKCDRFLISGIDQDLRKKTICTYIANMAKLLGVLVVAEGVETESEFAVCKNIGFDFIQGYFLQRPTLNPAEIAWINAKVPQGAKNAPVSLSRDTELLVREITRIEPINVNQNTKVLFDIFHHNLQDNFFPVVDKSGYPLGIIHEKTIKKYVYSPYGKDLLYNKSIAISLAGLVTKCPTIDIGAPQEKILEIYSSNSDTEGVIITKSQKYYGFLTAKSLLKLINEKNLAYAREINPLTGLPGNILINQYIYDTYQQTDRSFYYLYYDFNDFKPFNDFFGFSQGDRAIQRFAEILKDEYDAEREFIGHIGGDDFFVGIQADPPSLAEESRRAQRVSQRFIKETASLYDAMVAKRGYYLAKGRDGRSHRTNLLSVSVAILEILRGERHFNLEEIGVEMAKAKKEAKAERRVAVATF